MRRLARRAGLAVEAAKQGAALAAFVSAPSAASLRRLVEASGGAHGLAVRKLAQALCAADETVLPEDWAKRLQEAFCFQLPPLAFDECRGALQELERECAEDAPEVARATRGLLASEGEAAVGSVAQVYAADGLAFKVLRAGIDEELEMVSGLAKCAAPALAAVGRGDAAAILQQAAKDLEEQADLQLEMKRLREAGQLASESKAVLVPRAICSTRRVLVMSFAPSRQFHFDDAGEGRWRTEVAAALFFVASVISDALMHADLPPGNYGRSPEGRCVIYDLGSCISEGFRLSEFFVAVMEERWPEAMALCFSEEASVEEASVEEACAGVVDGRSFAKALSRLGRRCRFRPTMLRGAAGCNHFMRLLRSCGFAELSVFGADAAIRELQGMGWACEDEARRTLQRLHSAMGVATLAAVFEGDVLAHAAMSYPRLALSDERVAALLPYYGSLAPRLWARFAASGAVSEASAGLWLAALQRALG